jgi:acetoin utilization protein AcuB
MDAAIRLMKENAIKMLPVLKKGKLVGILTDGDLKRASASDATSLEIHELLYLLTQIRIKNIMTSNPITVPDDYTIGETAEILLENAISGAPVVDRKGQIVGVITQSDIFRVLLGLTGVKKKGIQFAFITVDRPGSIKELTDMIREHGGRMASILSSYEGVPEGRRKVYIRAYDIDSSAGDTLAEKLQAIATLLYLVDHQAERRRIFSDA